MENTERHIDRLAKYIMVAAAVAIIGAICWYFKSVLGYILIAVVVSLIAKPLVKLLKKVNKYSFRISFISQHPHIFTSS